MKWYLTKLVFQILNASKVQQFDEQLRIIKAENYNDALLQANEIAHTDENEFLDLYSNKVVWKFIAVTYLSEIETLESGIELCSQIFEKSSQENYLKTIKLKHEELFNKYQTIYQSG